MSYYEVLSLVVNLLVALTAIAAIVFTYASFRRQKTNG